MRKGPSSQITQKHHMCVRNAFGLVVFLCFCKEGPMLQTFSEYSVKWHHVFICKDAQEETSPVSCVNAYGAKHENTAYLLPIKQTSCTIQLPCDWCWWYGLRATASMWVSCRHVNPINRPIQYSQKTLPHSPGALDGCSVPSGLCGFPIQRSIPYTVPYRPAQ